MNTDEFLGFMNTLKSLYGDKFPRLTKEVLDVWYECLKDLDSGILHTALVDYVKGSEFSPTVAALRREYETVRQENVKSKAELKRLYYMTIAFYPCARDSAEVLKAWQGLMEGKTNRERLETARRVLNCVCRFVRSREESGCEELPDLSDFLKEVNVDELPC